MDKISDILITLGRLARDHNSIDKIILDNDSSKKLADYIYQKNQEIQRLNNIINELEKSIDIKLKEFENNKDYFIDEITLKDLKNELQELKGSESNGND